MILNFNTMENTEIPGFKNGDGTITAAMHIENTGKIMRLQIHPRSSIGLHTHETNYEICYVVSGHGKAIHNGHEEELIPGICHYCPKGDAHTIINTGNENLVLIAIVPETK